MPASPTWKPAAPGLVPAPDSGEYNYGDVQTFTQKYQGKYTDCVAGALPKGTIGSGATAGYIVQSSRVIKASGERGQLIIIWEGYGGGSGVLPESEYGLDPQDLNPATEKNDAFSGVTDDHFSWIKCAVFSAQDNSPNAYTPDQARAALEDLGEADPAWQLYDLLKRGVTNFYEPYFAYYLVEYFSSEPSFNTGGYLEAPGGPLSATIAALDLSCLREADKLEYSGGIWRRTRRWKCAPNSYWSNVLYS